MSAPTRRIGKRVHGSIYVHRQAVPLLDNWSADKVKDALRIAPTKSWNVVRVDRDSVTFLDYDDFETKQFPVLLGSTRVDLTTARCSHTDYRKSQNPLVLHRKEQIVGPDHPSREAWTRLTAELERVGLFDDLNRIGRQRHWNALLSAAGFDAEGRRE